MAALAFTVSDSWRTELNQTTKWLFEEKIQETRERLRENQSYLQNSQTHLKNLEGKIGNAKAGVADYAGRVANSEKILNELKESYRLLGGTIL